MSWDVLVFNYGGKPPASDEMEDAPEPQPLGEAARVRKRISEHLPGIAWSGAGSGVYEGDGFSIEFSLGKNDPIDSLMLHVRGGGDALAAMCAFANANDWSLYDMSTDEFLDPENPSPEGWEGFQQFRDKALGSRRTKKTKGAAKKRTAKAKNSPNKGNRKKK